MYFVYILRCHGDLLYTGITTDVQRRFREHSQQSGKGARFTRSHKAEKLVALWSTENRSLASKLEYRIKALTKEKKLKLIENTSAFALFFGEETAMQYKREPTEEMFP